FTRDNSRRLLDVVEYGLRQAARPPNYVVWLPPQLSCWGATSALPALLGQIKASIGAQPGPAAQEMHIQAVALVAGRPPRYIESPFDVVASTDSTSIPPALEVLVLPRTLAALVVHAPIGAQSGAPVPIGFVSFDARVVARVHAIVSDQIRRFNFAYD